MRVRGEVVWSAERVRAYEADHARKWAPVLGMDDYGPTHCVGGSRARRLPSADAQARRMR